MGDRLLKSRSGNIKIDSPINIDNEDISASAAILESKLALDNSTSSLDTAITDHTGDAALHFTEASIDHTAIANIGTNAHSVIDTHIANENIHVGKNYIINGDLRVNQDKTNASAAFGVVALDDVSATAMENGKFYVDRFTASETLTTVTGRYLSTAQPTNLPGGRSLKIISGDAPTTGKLGFSYKMEHPEIFAGLQVTVSALVKSNNADARLGINDGAYVAVATGDTDDTTDIGYGPGWKWLKLTLTVNSSAPFLSIQPRIVDAANGNVAIATSDYMEIAGLKLEFGSVATPFVPNSYADELLACQRYFEIGRCMFIGDVTDAVTYYYRQNFRVPKETADITAIELTRIGDVGFDGGTLALITLADDSFAASFLCNASTSAATFDFRYAIEVVF